MKPPSTQNSKRKNYPRFFLKVFVITAAIVLLGSMLLLTYVPEARSYAMFKIAPAYARDAHFIKLTKGDQEIYLLGTIHKDHLTTKDYSLLHLETVIKNLKPDYVLVEIKPEEIKKDNLGSGPMEMLFAILVARSEGMGVDGFDWWTKESIKPGASNPERDKKMLEILLQKLSEHKRVLVLTGFSHILDFSPALQKNGFTMTSFPKEQKDELFDITGKKFIYPKGMSYYLEKQVKIYQEEMKKETDLSWKKALDNGINNSQGLLKLIEETGELQ